MNGAAHTRMSFLRARRRLERVHKGIDLLHRKREALVREFFQLARPAVDVRNAIAEQANEAYAALLEALAIQGQASLRAAGWPARELDVEIRPGQVWGLSVSDIAERPAIRRSLASRGTAPGLAGPAAGEAATRFELLVDLLLDAAPKELLIRRLGDALALTSRQINTLERAVSPALEEHIATTRRVLDEREREEHLRLRHLLRKRRR
jgi:V/A-type H+-transporting ATPase subunit D